MTANFGDVVRANAFRGELTVQPRMGMSDSSEMRRGLLATKVARATTVGTITIDSYTRLGQLDTVRVLDRDGRESGLNGYPIVTRSSAMTKQLLYGIEGVNFPVQIRHGSATPEMIVAAMLRADLHATEGGPLSYCLPYGRTPVRQAIRAWSSACQMLAQQSSGPRPHLETFGGCMMGQLCPPALLVAISVLEALFFWQNGIECISLSYAQQTNREQDVDALAALHQLAAEHLPSASWHIVLYAYMGLYPKTSGGAELLLREASVIALEGGAHRLIVKTAAEAHHLPTIEQNIEALEVADQSYRGAKALGLRCRRPDSEVAHAARSIIAAVLNLDPDLGTALARGVELGIIDVPFCLHPDNAGATRSTVGPDGRVCWTAAGAVPPDAARADSLGRSHDLTSESLLDALTFVQRKFDTEADRDRASGERNSSLARENRK